jgi:hypothetical protein
MQPNAKELTYRIEWLDDGKNGFGEFSLNAGKQFLEQLKGKCGAYSHVIDYASGGPVIRSLSGFTANPCFDGKITTLQF